MQYEMRRILAFLCDGYVIFNHLSTKNRQFNRVKKEYFG